MKKKTKAQRIAKQRRNQNSRDNALRAIATPELAEASFSRHFREVRKIYKYHPELLPQWMHDEAAKALEEQTKNIIADINSQLEKLEELPDEVQRAL